MHTAAEEMGAAARSLDSEARGLQGVCGPGPFGAAVARFGAAWGGELLSWSLGGQTLSEVAGQNADQFVAATGG